MNKIKLSFIVPVYNVEPYLRKCVESLINQDFSDYEIILVDDGSTDGSGELCDKIARANDEMSRKMNDEPEVLNEPHLQSSMSRDKSLNKGKPIIRVIHQKNGGLSAARNAGLKAAKEEYVCFVDSDDYWEENVLGGLMEQVESEQLDVLRFDYQNVRIVNSGKIKDKREEIREYEVFQPNKNPHQVDRCTEVEDGETYLNKRMGYECYAVMFIVRRTILIDDRCIDNRSTSIEDRRLKNDDCLFKDGILFEDTEWTPRMLIRAKRVNATQTIVYNYFWRAGSITQKFDISHINKKINSLMQVNLSLQGLLSNVQNRRWIEGCMADNTYCILNNAAAYDYKTVPYWIGVIKENRMLPLRGYKIRKMTMLRYTIINMSPRIYCWLRHLRMHYLRK